MKPGFILYANQRWPIKNLSLEEKWELLDMIFEYNTTGTFGKSGINGVNIVFEFLKIQFDLDNDKYEKVCIRNKENIVKRRDKNTSGKSGIPENTRNTNKNININKNKNINKEDNKQFEAFWNLYNKKIARDECLKKWNFLKQEDREKIIATLPDRLKKFGWEYQPHPSTYLNQKRWNDEVASAKVDKEKALEERRRKRDEKELQHKSFTSSLITNGNETSI